MASKNKSSVMASGLGMGMRFLELLTQAIRENGGFDEMLHFLTQDSEQTRNILKEVAQLIVSSKWKVPKSLVEKMVAEESIKSNCNNTDLVEWDCLLWWDIISLEKTFNIPVVYFGNAGDADRPIPESVIEQIPMDKEVTSLVIIQWENEPHVVVYHYELFELGSKGLMEGWSVSHSGIGIAPLKYFDMQR